jgi:hypothetical protein
VYTQRLDIELSRSGIDALICLHLLSYVMQPPTVILAPTSIAPPQVTIFPALQRTLEGLSLRSGFIPSPYLWQK